MYSIETSPESSTSFSGIHSDAARLAMRDPGAVHGFVAATETLTALGHGGSESLALLLERSDGSRFVRKILDEGLMTARWDPLGKDVMLPPWRKAKQQAAYLRALPHSVRDLFPRVLAISERTEFVAGGPTGQVERRQLIYDMTYVPGIEVSRFVAQHRPSPRVVAALYTCILRMLRTHIHCERRRAPRGPTLETSYFQKIEQRLGLCQRTVPHTFSDALIHAPTLRLDGRDQVNALAVVERLRARPEALSILEPRWHSLVVGDTNTENIKILHPEILLDLPDDVSIERPPFTWEQIGLRFMDPRAIGFHEDGVDTGSDDPMYDAKPWHNSVGNYDLIHGEHFDLHLDTSGTVPELAVDFHRDHPYARSYAGIEQHFPAVMRGAWDVHDPRGDLAREDPWWAIRFAFVMGTHFAAMPPFHLTKTQSGVALDDPQLQKRALGVYREGVRWLNLALDLIDGRTDHLFGVPVATPRRGA